MKQYRVPVVVEIMLERVTNNSMGTEIDKINEFEPLAESLVDAPLPWSPRRTTPVSITS